MAKIVIMKYNDKVDLSYKGTLWLSEHGYKDATEEITRVKTLLENTDDKLAKHLSMEDMIFTVSIPLTHPLLVRCIEELGKEACHAWANPVVMEI